MREGLGSSWCVVKGFDSGYGASSEDREIQRELGLVMQTADKRLPGGAMVCAVDSRSGHREAYRYVCDLEESVCLNHILTVFFLPILGSSEKLQTGVWKAGGGGDFCQPDYVREWLVWHSHFLYLVDSGKMRSCKSFGGSREVKVGICYSLSSSNQRGLAKAYRVALEKRGYETMHIYVATAKYVFVFVWVV